MASSPAGLAAAFASVAAVPGDLDALEAALAAAVARARAAWPELDVAPERFARYLGERVAAQDLGAVRVEDLWAACACASGENRAIAAVEARYFRDVEAALGKMGLTADRIAEVKQGLRRVLFAGDDGVPPRIGEYRGTGYHSAG